MLVLATLEFVDVGRKSGTHRVLIADLYCGSPPTVNSLVAHNYPRLRLGA
jgi:hypothetical protein